MGRIGKEIMSHQQQKDFIIKVKSQYPQYFNNVDVLDVGSLDINGSARVYFTNSRYTGLDLSDGKGVDIVCSGHEYDAPDNTYDVVSSFECFEHNQFWLETFVNMVRICKPKGLVIFTCATTGRPEHGTRRTSPADSPFTLDYYGNLTAADFENNLAISEMFDSYKFEVETSHNDLFFYGIKK